MIDLRICVYCSFHQASLNCRGNMILAFLMLTKRYRSLKIIFQLGFQLLKFLSLTTTLQVFSPTVQIYSACFLTNHSPTLDSMVNWLLPLTFLSPWITLHQLSLHLNQSMKPSYKRTNLCEILAQRTPRHNNIIIPCCLSLLCCRSLFHVPLMIAIWGASVFKLPSSHSTDNQINCLIFFFLTKMIQANMCEFHQLNLSSIQMIYPYIIFLVLIFRFKEERVSWVLDQQFPNLAVC